MIPPRLIRRAIHQWQSWRSRNAIRRACPRIAELDRREREYRRSHKRGSSSIQKAKREAMTAVLAGREDWRVG